MMQLLTNIKFMSKTQKTNKTRTEEYWQRVKLSYAREQNQKIKEKSIYRGTNYLLANSINLL